LAFYVALYDIGEVRGHLSRPERTSKTRFRVFKVYRRTTQWLRTG